MFVETLKHARGTTQGTATEAHALLLMRLALRQSGALEATPAGGVRITQPRCGGVLAIELTPAAAPAPFDDTVLPYLAIVAGGDAWAQTRADGTEVIGTFLDEIAPDATALLLERRLVVEQGHDRRVRLTLAGGLGIVAAVHRTSTAGTTAACACGHTEEHPDPHRAHLAARGHLRRATAAFVQHLEPAFTGAIACTTTKPAALLADHT